MPMSLLKTASKVNGVLPSCSAGTFSKLPVRISVLRMVPVPNPSPAMVRALSVVQEYVECLAAVVHGVVDDRDRDGLAGLAGLERQGSVLFS